MSTAPIPSVTQLQRAVHIAEQIEKLEGELAALLRSERVGTPSSSSPPATGRRKRRRMSAQARAKIAAAQRARWAKSKGRSGGATRSARKAKAPAAKKRKGGITPEGRAKLAAAMKARWAERKKGGPAPN